MDSGTTYIGIKIVKHSGSSAFTHLKDMGRVRSKFELNFQNNRSQEEKVMIVTVDGGPDENWRYENTINCSVEYFVENGQDGSFFSTNGPD